MSGCINETSSLKDYDDNLKLVFVSEQYGHPEIFSMYLNGMNRQRLTDTPENVENAQPSVSPNGNKIAFISNRDGTHNIYIMDSNGKNVKQLTYLNAPYSAISPVWSPNGTRIAFIKTIPTPDSFGNPLSREIFTIDIDGKNEIQLTEDWELSPNRIDWHSQDKLVFVTTKWGGLNSAFVVDAKNLDIGTTISVGEQIGYFSFSPDSPFKLVCAGKIEDGILDIYLIEIELIEDGENIRRHQRLTKTEIPGANNRQPVFSSDGKLIVFTSNREKVDQLYVMDANGLNESLVSIIKSHEYDPRWFPVTAK